MLKVGDDHRLSKQEQDKHSLMIIEDQDYYLELVAMIENNLGVMQFDRGKLAVNCTARIVSDLLHCQTDLAIQNLPTNTANMKKMFYSEHGINIIDQLLQHQAMSVWMLEEATGYTRKTITEYVKLYVRYNVCYKLRADYQFIRAHTEKPPTNITGLHFYVLNSASQEAIRNAHLYYIRVNDEIQDHLQACKSYDDLKTVEFDIGHELICPQCRSKNLEPIADRLVMFCNHCRDRNGNKAVVIPLTIRKNGMAKQRKRYSDKICEADEKELEAKKKAYRERVAKRRKKNDK